MTEFDFLLINPLVSFYEKLVLPISFSQEIETQTVVAEKNGKNTFVQKVAHKMLMKLIPVQATYFP